MIFLEETFPACASFGYQASPGYSVQVTPMWSVLEARTRMWSRPLLRFQVRVGPQLTEEVQKVIEFWHAVGGKECGFRIKDWSDYLSCHVGETATPFDQPIAIEGSPGAFHLIKQYVAGARTQLREITKPVAGTIRIANESGVEQAASHWTLDTTTGVVTPTGGFVGTPTTWGGEFDVPVRFDEDALPVTIDEISVQS